MKMKRAEVIGLFNGLQRLGGLEGLKCSYAIVKTGKKLKAEIDTLRESVKDSEAYKEFEKKRLELCQKYCFKDETGKPLMKDGYFVGLENNADFLQAGELLKEEFKEALEGKKKQEQEYIRMLEEEIEIEIHQMELADVPKNITVEQMSILEKLIKE